MNTAMNETETPIESTNTTRRNLIPEGKYRARPVKWALVRNERSGKHTYAVDFELKNGHTVTWYGALATEDHGRGSAWDITARTLIALGWDGDDIRRVQLTRAAYVTIAHEEFDGELRAKVVAVDVSVTERSAVTGRELDEIAEFLKSAGTARARR